MTQAGSDAGDGRAPAGPQKTTLRRILEERPEARRRLGRAVAELLGTGLFTLATVGVLLIWHLRRRGRLIRERLGPPRVVHWPDPEDLKSNRNP